MRAPYAGRKVDATAKTLTAHAKALGLGVVNVGGVVDAVLWYRHVTRVIDWKSEGEGLTESQGKLLVAGCPIHFVATAAQLELVAADMKREAQR
jgi:hypothetical protein